MIRGKFSKQLKLTSILEKMLKSMVMHSNSEHIASTSYNGANKVIEKLFESLRSRFQDNLENQWEEVKLFLI